ncbi:hypothetical protein [Janibacter sp. G56]|uniref:hypothetical protein n=1 Tax=Janibacter sp. G56 TaxID=3418717 RepID=UPI003D0854FA
MHARAAGRQRGHHVLLAAVERYPVKDRGEHRQLHVVGRPREARWAPGSFDDALLGLQHTTARVVIPARVPVDAGAIRAAQHGRLGDQIKFRRQVDRQATDRVVDDPLDDLSHPVSRHGDAPHLA